MPKAVSMVLSLSLICLISGVALGGLYNGTKERIDVQILQNMKMPAVEKVMVDADNNLLDDRRELKLGPKDKHLLFPAKKARTFTASLWNPPVKVLAGMLAS